MPPQSLPKPAQSEERCWSDNSPNWNMPTPEARTLKTENPEKTENIAKEPAQNTP